MEDGEIVLFSLVFEAFGVINEAYLDFDLFVQLGRK
jgi:hypothetical protein